MYPVNPTLTMADLLGAEGLVPLSPAARAVLTARSDISLVVDNRVVLTVTLRQRYREPHPGQCVETTKERAFADAHRLTTVLFLLGQGPEGEARLQQLELERTAHAGASAESTTSDGESLEVQTRRMRAHVIRTIDGHVSGPPSSFVGDGVEADAESARANNRPLAAA